MMRSLITCLYFFLLLHAGFAQQPAYRHYGVAQGLPSSEVYHVYQDSKGFIWFATNMGVTRFDGNEFQNFDLEDGLTDNTVFEIYEDYRGRIWFLTFNLRLSYYQNGEIHTYQYNQQIREAMSTTKELYQKSGFYVDSSDNLYLSIKRQGLLRIDSLGNFQHLTHEKNDELEVFNFPDKMLVPKSTPHNALHKKIHINRRNISHTLRTDAERKVDIHRSYGVKRGGEMMLYFDSRLWHIAGDSLQSSILQPELIWMSCDRDQHLWLGTRQGAILSNRFDLTSAKTRFLEEHAVSSVMQDQEGGFWFSTLQDGVFYAPNIEILNYSKDDGLVHEGIDELAADTSGNVWIGFKQPMVSKWDGEVFLHYPVKNTQQAGISALHYDEYLQRLWIGRWDNLYFLMDREKNKIIREHQGRIYVKDVFTRNNEAWVGRSICVGYFKNGKNVYFSHLADGYRHQVDAVYVIEDTLYIGTLNGLWKSVNHSYQSLGKENDLLYHRITDIKEWNNYIVLGTRGAGVLLKKGNEVYQITEEDGLISNSIKSIEVAADAIWTSTNRGLSKIQVNDLRKNSYQVFNISNHNGLPSPETNDIAIQDSLVYVATNAGLTCFNMNQVHPNNHPPQIYVKNIKINDRDTLIRDTFNLAYNQNFFTISYKGLSYRETGQLDYRYRMLGLDSTWKKTNRRVKSFTTLPPGEYLFQVMASNEDGVWSNKPLSIAFQIDKPYWQTWWFIGMVVLAIIALLWAFIQYRIRMVKRRRELLQNINEYKQKMLRQQMNPHFIFNTLNSIQYFLLDEDTTSSLTYLSKFAKLMRIVLDNSQHTFIPIEDEIRGLRLYLELESLRFEESFDYEIKVDEEVNTFEYKIPALLIQPYVENSIRHGLLHKNGKGLLLVRLTQQEDSLFLIIEDNGIGRKKADEIKMNQGAIQQSLGSKITQDRIDILNSLYSNEIDIQYVDLEDDKGNAQGTRVEIRLPFVF